MKLFQYLSTFFSSKPKERGQSQPKQRERLGASNVDYYRAKKSVHFPFDFDRWYPRLKEYTFPSTILPITPQTARAMVHFYQQKFLDREELTLEDIEQLQELERILLHAMEVYESGVFPRMSNRSPKDGLPLLEDSETLLSKYKTALESSDDPNEKLIKLSELQMKSLHCQTPQQVMNLLLTSERIYTDLILALACLRDNPDDEWSTSIILREWQPTLREQNEFRLFVYQGKVTAISQYNHTCLYPSLTANEHNQEVLNALNDRLTEFAKKAHPEIGMKDYILDLAVVDDQIRIVELNPFAESTGGCLFSWRADHDLLHGNLESLRPCLRVRMEKRPDIKDLVEVVVEEQETVESHNNSPYYELLHEKTAARPG
ncbi:ATP-grasp domain-containing protein [Legionella impletisoli]|uniref:ATP-grasp domain-containing protein n=1 Tax=Legionella impletisoli TaxID=343510 RepID=A0A917K0E9_9GAMM|nr:ATP-grasp domain-containing protein [Legionella impletisoli]GGI92502.1 hypothetical protein GCM10007966_21430 [Legionella impletisoli]